MNYLYYKLDESKNVVPCNTITETDWNNRRVCETGFRVYQYRKPKKGGYKKESKKVSVWISTVFLVLDHSFDGKEPLVFETMVFFGNRTGRRSPYEQYQVRCSTWEQAVQMHKDTVKLISNRHRKH